jgi:predicted Zn-dependent peptidase
MMEQGGGDLDGFALSLAAERLGADLSVLGRRDYSVASLEVTASNLKPALALLADVVLRPQFDGQEWVRSQALWLEDLAARAFQPRALAGLAGDAALYGAEHGYGRPVDGLLASVRDIRLDDVTAFHAASWRLDDATFVVVGDTNTPDLRAAVSAAFTDMPTPPGPRSAQSSPTAPTKAWPRFVIVDRPDSPQTVLRLTWPGPTMDADDRAPLDLVDFVLGGSFTSRLNSNLREDKGYTYGAKSRLPTARGAGPFTAEAAVQAEVTGKALKELLSELEGIGKAGPTEVEVAKARASLRNDDVQAYETVAGAADRVALLAGLGLPGRFDADHAAARARQTPEAIAEAARFFFGERALLVAVGDRASILAQLAEEGIDLGEPELRDAEGNR